MEKLTNEQIEAKAAELTEKFKCKVTPIVITADDGSQVVGYFQEPQYDVLMYATDAFIEKQMSKAAEATINDTLIKDESDPRIMSNERQHARIKASFTNACMKLVVPYVDEYKKK